MPGQRALSEFAAAGTRDKEGTLAPNRAHLCTDAMQTHRGDRVRALRSGGLRRLGRRGDRAGQGPEGGRVLRPAEAPAEGRRRADLAAQGEAPDAGRGREIEQARPLHHGDRPGQDRRRVRRGQRPEGKAAEEGLAGDHLRPRDDRDRRQLRPQPDHRRQPDGGRRHLHRSAGRGVGQGRLRRRAHRLPRPRHAQGGPPLPDRRAGGPQRRRHRQRRARPRPQDRQEVPDRRPLAGRPRGAVGCRPRRAAVRAEAEAPRDGRLRAGLAHRRTGRPAPGADLAEHAERARGADRPRRRGPVRAAQRPRVPLGPGTRALPDHRPGLPRPARPAGLIRRHPALGDAARRLRPQPAARHPQREQPGRHHEGPDPDPPGHRGLDGLPVHDRPAEPGARRPGRPGHLLQVRGRRPRRDHLGGGGRGAGVHGKATAARVTMSVLSGRY